MIVFDETVKSKALVCLVFSNLLLVLAQENCASEKSIKPFSNCMSAEVTEDSQQILKINQQVTVPVPGNEIKIYQYLDKENRSHNLSLTITPCLSAVKWSLAYRTPEEIIDIHNVSAFLENDTYEIASAKTITVENARKGWYYLIFHPIGIDSMASVYFTMDSGSPFDLNTLQKSNIILRPRPWRSLKVSWEESLVNPHNTGYCLVVNTFKEYTSLCAAEKEGPIIKGTDVPVVVNLNSLKLEKKRKIKFRKFERETKRRNLTVIVCMDRKMQVTFTELKSDVKYYFNLFAINNKTNLTIPYGKSFFKYNFTFKPIAIKQGVKRVVNLKKMEGEALFKFKVNKPAKELHFYVLACGGAVDVEIKKKKIMKKRGRKSRVYGYKMFKILYPKEGEQYFLKINAPNVDELNRIKYVEVFVVLFPEKKSPFLLLPKDPNLYEFKSQKTCDSVTIGWIPLYDASLNNTYDTYDTYCVVVWENVDFNYADLFRGYFQCNLERIPLKWSYFSSPRDSSISSRCEEMATRKKKSITNYKIRDLKPDTSYTIRVTVKRNGRTLSYKFLNVYTKHSCEY